MLGGILVRSGSIRGRAVSDRVECAAVMVIIRACPWWVTGTALEARVQLYCPRVFCGSGGHGQGRWGSASASGRALAIESYVERRRDPARDTCLEVSRVPAAAYVD